jgi:fluoride exporter
MKLLVSCLWVGAGGFAGSVARFLVARASAALFGVGFPYGTFIINISGSFLLGLVATVTAMKVLAWAEPLRLAVAVGFLGAYTTFSTFTYESNSLLEDGEWLRSMVNLFGSLLAGMIAVRVGILLAKSWV